MVVNGPIVRFRARRLGYGRGVSVATTAPFVADGRDSWADPSSRCRPEGLGGHHATLRADLRNLTLELRT